MATSATARTNDYRDPAKLKNHPLNIKLYGGNPPPADFIESIRVHGVLQQLLITPDDVVIAGHQRMKGARIAGLKEVPVCVIRDITDPLELERLLIVSNRQREKDNETLAREAAHLLEIEKVQAEARQKASQTAPGRKVGAHAPSPSKPEENAKTGKAVTRVAEAIGTGEKSAAKLAETGAALNQAEQSGDTKKADEIKAGLEKSIAAGHRAAVPPKKPPTVSSVKRDGKKTIAGPPYDVKAITAQFGAVMRSIDDMARAMNLNNSPPHRETIAAVKVGISAFESFTKLCDNAYAKRK